MENDVFVHDTETVFETENKTDEDTTVTIYEKRHTYHDDKQETTPGHELKVDEDEHDDDDEFDTSEGLKKENVIENDDSVGKLEENVTKLLQSRRGLRNIQEKNTNTYKNPVENVTKLLQCRRGLGDTHVINTNTYNDHKHETPPEDELEVGEEGDHEGDGEDDTIEELKIKM